LSPRSASFSIIARADGTAAKRQRKATALMGAALLLHQGPKVSLLFDALVAVECARVVGEHGLGRFGVEDVHALFGRDD
jgi:hypothetical protein